MKLKAAKTSALLSLLFLVVYPTCNWITSHRTDVGTWYFEWERHIPFVPIFIVPYMSIDLFFVGAPFLCASDRELQTFAKRMAFAIIAAGICFLLLPLRFAFGRLEVSGWLGTIFNTFRSFDRPYNLFPSLHITLRTILADTYAQHTRGAVRVASHVWFSLIGFSTVLTYQHHVVDVASGFVLAAICFYLFRETPVRLPLVRNARIGTYYTLGCIACAGSGIALWPEGGVLLWPAVSLGIITVAYLGVGPGVFRKERGRLPLSVKIVLGPVLLGQHLSLLYYRRQSRAWDEVAPGVLIGRVLSKQEAAVVSADAVLDLTGEFSEAKPFLAVTYRNIPVLDLTAPTTQQLRDAVAFITEHAANGKVYIHCKIGYSRSAAVVGAYLLAIGKAKTAEDAVAILRAARPSIVVRPEAWAALRQFTASV
jgi:protein-tyrosine phosphatase/membrane-associated phospholipid phosphatase